MGTNADQQAHQVAIGWLIASIVAAGFVLLFLALVVGGRPFALPGLVAVVVLLWFAQQQFTETHRRRYHRWPPGQAFWTGSPERHAIAQAWTRRDPDRGVELSRRLGIGLLALAAMAALVFIGSGVAVRI